MIFWPAALADRRAEWDNQVLPDRRAKAGEQADLI
jgi:hypothetical protein